MSDAPNILISIGENYETLINSNPSLKNEFKNEFDNILTSNTINVVEFLKKYKISGIQEDVKIFEIFLKSLEILKFIQEDKIFLFKDLNNPSTDLTKLNIAVFCFLNKKIRNNLLIVKSIVKIVVQILNNNLYNSFQIKDISSKLYDSENQNNSVTQIIRPINNLPISDDQNSFTTIKSFLISYDEFYIQCKGKMADIFLKLEEKYTKKVVEGFVKDISLNKKQYYSEFIEFFRNIKFINLDFSEDIKNIPRIKYLENVKNFDEKESSNKVSFSSDAPNVILDKETFEDILSEFLKNYIKLEGDVDKVYNETSKVVNSLIKTKLYLTEINKNPGLIEHILTCSELYTKTYPTSIEKIIVAVEKYI